MTTWAYVKWYAEAISHNELCDIYDNWSKKPCNCPRAKLLTALDAAENTLREILEKRIEYYAKDGREMNVNQVYRVRAELTEFLGGDAE